MGAKLRIGFVGVGQMGQAAHLRNYASLDDCEVAAIAEIRTELGRKVAARYGVRNVYPSHVEMLAHEKLDGMVASQPFTRHGLLVPELLQAGVPVFTEKPLAGSVEVGRRIVDAVRASGTWLMLGYHKRSDPATEYAKAEIDRLKASGELGKLRYVRILMPAGDWIAGGFNELVQGEAAAALETDPPPQDMDEEGRQRYTAFVNYYIHQVNLLRHLFGEPYQVRHADPGGVLLVARSAGGAAGVIEMSPYKTTAAWQESALVCFERGTVKLDLPAPLACNRPGRVRILRDPAKGTTPLQTEPHLPWVHAMRQQAAHFLAAVRGERKPPCEAAEGLEDLIVAREYIRMLLGR